MQAKLEDYKELKLKLDGIVPPGHGFHRNLLLDTLYASLPRDPQAKVQIYNAEIVPGGYTNWHCHNARPSSSLYKDCSRHIFRKACWSRPRPASAIRSRSPNSIADTIRTRSCPICASDCVLPRPTAST